MTPQDKSDAATKRAATIAEKRELAARLAAVFPDVAFTITRVRGWPRISWTGGPSRETVDHASGLRVWSHDRAESAAEIERWLLRANPRDIARSRARAAQKWLPLALPLFMPRVSGVIGGARAS